MHRAQKEHVNSFRPLGINPLRSSRHFFLFPRNHPPKLPRLPRKPQHPSLSPKLTKRVSCPLPPSPPSPLDPFAPPSRLPPVVSCQQSPQSLLPPLPQRLPRANIRLESWPLPRLFLLSLASMSPTRTSPMSARVCGIEKRLFLCKIASSSSA